MMTTMMTTATMTDDGDVDYDYGNDYDCVDATSVISVSMGDYNGIRNDDVREGGAGGSGFCGGFSCCQ